MERRSHTKRDWQVEFDQLQGIPGQYGPGGRAAMTDEECKIVVMAHERTLRRVEKGLPQPKSQLRKLTALDRRCRGANK